MKYQASQVTGTVVLYPNAEPKPEADCVIREATDADLVVIADNTKGLLRAAPNDPENHDGDWHLVRDAYVVPVVRLEKLAIRRKLRDFGKEDAFDAALASIPHAQRDWNDAQYIMSDDPLFVEHKDDFKSLLSLSDEQFNSVLTP